MCVCVCVCVCASLILNMLALYELRHRKTFRMHTHAHLRTHIHTHLRTHTHTHLRTHTHMYTRKKKKKGNAAKMFCLTTPFPRTENLVGRDKELKHIRTMLLSAFIHTHTHPSAMSVPEYSTNGVTVADNNMNNDIGTHTHTHAHT